MVENKSTNIAKTQTAKPSVVDAIVMPVTCKRHKWKVIEEFASNFPLPNGYPSGEYRLCQKRKCCVCGDTDIRWKPKKA